MELIEVEVKARTVELAKQAALEELGVKDHDQVNWEILQEPSRGFLGVGRQDAIVQAKRKPPKRRRSRGGRGARGSKARSGRQTTGSPKKRNVRPTPAKSAGRSKQPANRAKQSKQSKGQEGMSIEEQKAAAESFLGGLLEAVEINGKVNVRHEKDLIVAEIEGEDTEMLVGQRGGGIEALHTIAKSVMKRKTSGGARLRLDVAGYGERRREALAIYAAGLAEQVSAEGGELMLEPMNAADRKVIHDTVSKHTDVQSFSEGEAPQRYVVIAYTAP